MLTPTPSVHAEVIRLADQLERSVLGGAWHGPALLEALEEVDVDLATARPHPGAHTISEIAFHAAYWIAAAGRRLDGVDDASADASWPTAGPVTPEEWQREVGAIERAYRDLHATVLALEDGRLDDAVPGSDPTVRGLLLGVLQHTAYHAGQIVWIRRALESDHDSAEAET